MQDYIIVTDDMLDDSYLEHYGVPGMKWGHRKASGVSSTGSSSSRKKKAKKIAKVALGAAAAAGVGYAAYRYAKDPVLRSTVNYYGGIAKGAAKYDAQRAGAKLKKAASVAKGNAKYYADKAAPKVKSAASVAKGAAKYDAQRAASSAKSAASVAKGNAKYYADKMVPKAKGAASVAKGAAKYDAQRAASSAKSAASVIKGNIDYARQNKPAKPAKQNRKQQSTRNEAMDDIIRRYTESARAAGKNADDAYARATQFANDIRNGGKKKRR